MFPALANRSKRLADSLGVLGMGEALLDTVVQWWAPLDTVVGDMGCPMVGTVEASTRPLSSVVRA